MLKAFEISTPLPARGSAMALRRQLVDHLLKIKPGVGERFLSDHELSRIAGLSRPTVRRALDDLEREGWIERRPGIGTFIGPRAGVTLHFSHDDGNGLEAKRTTRLALMIHMLGDLGHDWYTGGVIAGIVASTVVIVTKDWWVPHLFAATFIAQSMLAAVAGLVLTQLKSPPPMPREERVQNPGRPLSEIARQPLFIAAVACGVVSYVIMNLVMTSAPIAMVGCGHSVTDSTLGIQWHVLGMYAPSFITGHLIVRFGTFRIITLGLSMLLVSAAISLAGESIAHFWIGLALLGVGWNFAFIGATTLVTRCYRPEERNKVQSLNDFLIFGTMALGSFASGKILATLGWAFVNATVFPPVLAVGALLAWVALRQRRQLA